MIRYAVISKDVAPYILPLAPVKWEFTVGQAEYVGLEWGDNDNVPYLDGWQVFADCNEFNKWVDNVNKQPQ